jgi:phosphate transport system substrate-binding protein
LIRADELALAEKLGMQLREVFVGYDAVTVIVNPSSPLRTLDVEAVAKIFAQHIVNWSEVGGPSAAIRVLGRPGYSGTYRFFKERVLTRLGPDTGFGANVASIEKTAQIVDLVARDVNAIGYVSLAQVTPDVRALPLSTQPNGAAVAPSQQTIRDGSYPFTRPLVLYLRPDSGQDAHALVDFAISKDGQAIVEKNGFVSMPAGLPGGLAAEAAMPPTAARREVIRIYFDPSSTAIAQDSMPDLMTAAAAVRARRSVLVVGNADSSGTLQDNRQLAHQRAEVVAARLKESASRGASITVEVAAADHPLETNETSDGRRANRRVDVIVLTR